MSTGSHNSEPGRVPDDPGTDLLAALVQAERASMDPPADGARQTWERVAASVAVGGAPPVQPSSISGPASTATALWIKVVLGVVIGGVVAAAGYRLSSDPKPEPESVPATVARSDAEAPQPPPPSPPLVAPRAQPPPPASAVAVVPVPSPPEPPKTSPSKPARTAPPEPATPATSDLTEETRLLARARARLRAGSPGDALSPLAEHARRFPQGQLTEDRLVLQAQALCESGDTNAGLKIAAALRKEFPSSSHLPRVNRSCE